MLRGRAGERSAPLAGAPAPSDLDLEELPQLHQDLLGSGVLLLAVDARLQRKHSGEPRAKVPPDPLSLQAPGFRDKVAQALPHCFSAGPSYKSQQSDAFWGP